jgi:protease-4
MIDLSMFKRKGRVAVVSLNGPIFRKNIDEQMAMLRAVEKNRIFKGVMLELESPGGSATASEVLYHRLKRLAAQKPLYCYALMAASGGYMAALAAKRIYVPSTAIVGSIGVLSVKPVIRDLMERIGVGVEVTKRGSMKDMTLFHRESTEEERRSMEALHEEIYEQFIRLVSEARGMTPEQVRGLATGEVFSGIRAVELGLADTVADFDTAMDELYRETGVKPGREVHLRPRRPLLKWVMDRATRAMVEDFWWRMG